jgi:hypothetical protein
VRRLPVSASVVREFAALACPLSRHSGKVHHHPPPAAVAFGSLGGGEYAIMASTTLDKTSGKPRRKRRWLQFGLGTLLGLLTLVAVVLALVVNAAGRQRRAVALVERMGGQVYYDQAETEVPVWLRDLLGEYYFRSAIDIDLDGTKVSDRDLEHLKGLTALQSLSLYGTPVSDAGLAHLQGLTGLEWLNLGGTRVTDAGLVHIKDLTGLRELYLSDTDVSDAGLAHLKGLAALQWLFMDGTQVSDAGLVHLKGLTRLQRLYLARTKVSDPGLAHLTGLTRLLWVDLPDTQVSNAGIADLRADLPDCQIEGP